MKNVFECKIQKKSKELNCMTVGSLKEEVYKGWVKIHDTRRIQVSQWDSKVNWLFTVNTRVNKLKYTHWHVHVLKN